MKRTICHISPVAIHSTRWIEAFASKSYDVSLITDSKTWVPQKPRNVPTYILPTLTRNNFCHRFISNSLSITKLLITINPDIVQLHVLHHYSPIIRLNRIPYILHSWGREVLELQNTNMFQTTLAKYAATRAKKVIVDAECLRKIWLRIGIPRNKLEVIPFGVDTSLFRPRKNSAYIRRKLGIKESETVIISTRPFYDHYDVECLIKAAAKIVRKYDMVKFIVKGTGPQEDNIRKLASDLGVGCHIRFIGRVQYREIPQYLTAADIYVSTSFLDSTSVSLLEAMACGLPPITTNISGNREWIRNQVNGLLYTPKDHEALGEKITQLIEHEDMRKQFGERSHQIVMEKATWKECVSKMEAVYESLT